MADNSINSLNMFLALNMNDEGRIGQLAFQQNAYVMGQMPAPATPPGPEQTRNSSQYITQAKQAGIAAQTADLSKNSHNSLRQNARDNLALAKDSQQNNGSDSQEIQNLKSANQEVENADKNSTEKFTDEMRDTENKNAAVLDAKEQAKRKAARKAQEQASKEKIKNADAKLASNDMGWNAVDALRNARGVWNQPQIADMAASNPERFGEQFAYVIADVCVGQVLLNSDREQLRIKEAEILNLARNGGERAQGINAENIKELDRKMADLPKEEQHSPWLNSIKGMVTTFKADAGKCEKKEAGLNERRAQIKEFQTQAVKNNRKMPDLEAVTKAANEIGAKANLEKDIKGAIGKEVVKQHRELEVKQKELEIKNKESKVDQKELQAQQKDLQLKGQKAEIDKKEDINLARDKINLLRDLDQEAKADKDFFKKNPEFMEEYNNLKKQYPEALKKDNHQDKNDIVGKLDPKSQKELGEIKDNPHKGVKLEGGKADKPSPPPTPQGKDIPSQDKSIPQ
jgi:hypothetical protein